MDGWPYMGDRSPFRGPMQLRASVDRLVLSQGPSRFYRVLLWLLVAGEAFGLLALFGMLFGTQSQHLVCERQSGVCELNGHSLARLADVRGVELRRDHITKQGDFYEVTLVLRDGTRKNASFQGAQSDRSIAEYRASVDAMRRFLADPSQPRVDTTFVYQAGFWENFRMGTASLLFLFFVIAMFGFYRRSSLIFDSQAGIITGVTRGLIGRATQNEIGMDRISAIGDRRSGAGRVVELQLTDGNRLVVAIAKKRALPESLVSELSRIVGKPIQEAA